MKPINLGQGCCHTKWGLPFNWTIDFDQSGCSTSYTTRNLMQRLKITNIASLMTRTALPSLIHLVLLMP